MLDNLLTCHQWLAIGIGVDPITMLSSRDRSILKSLGARFIALNATARDGRTLSVQCADADFIAWTKQHNLQAAIVRPDQFIADRLDPTKDLTVLTPVRPPRGSGFASGRGVVPQNKFKESVMLQVVTQIKSGPGSIELPRSPAPIVKANELLFVHFERPDLKRAEKYLRDFGLVVATRTDNELFMRGTGSQPYIYRITRGREARFLGLGLSVSSEADLQKLAKATGRAIERSDAPVGGSLVRLSDPEGVAVHVLFGFVPNRPLPVRPAIPHNAPNLIVRINDTQRPSLEPPQVTKLGHLVLETPDFDRSVRWYMDTLGFIPSDVMCLSDGTPVGSFMRLDRGAEPTDHHTLFVAMGLESKVDHVAFEVVDLDAIEMGQQVMMANRHRHSWGVGAICSAARFSITGAIRGDRSMNTTPMVTCSTLRRLQAITCWTGKAFTNGAPICRTTLSMRN